jgi:hypothetical protein
MASTETTDKVPVFNFMMVRAPYPVDPGVLRRDYVHDEVLVASSGVHTHVPPDLNSVEHFSPVGKLIHQKVFCSDPKPIHQAMDDLLEALLGLLTPFAPMCDNGDEASTNGSASRDIVEEVLSRKDAREFGKSREEAAAADSYEDAVAVEVEERAEQESETAAAETRTAARLLIRDLERYAYIERDGFYYLLPDRLEQLVTVPLVPQLIRARPILESELRELDRERLVQRLEALFDGRMLHAVVFDKGNHSADYVRAKRALFDALYLLYVLRRWTTVNLEHVIAGLRVLHVLEALAIDRVYERARSGPVDPSERALLGTLASRFPSLQGWTPKVEAEGFPLIADEAALEAYLSATPVVHPIFARLFWYAKPFNDIKPIGVGDLKVVKQWLRGYKVGEIAHIENVLLKEAKSRVHRHVEKSQEVFSYASDYEEETHSDSQTTDRFELKRETDEVVKSNLSASAGLNVNVTYEGGYKVISTVTGNFAYTRDQTEQDKVASNYAHDVVEKAVSRIQSKVSQQRTTTTTFETEETNRHAFDNKDGDDHISGLYRWLDKEYQARLYNYGKRMMFEFVLPEPSAFLVESRLRAFEAELEIPRPPTPPGEVKLPQWLENLSPDDIDADEFKRLSKLYDLSEFTFPVLIKHVDFVDSATGKDYFSERGIDGSTWQGRTFTCRLNSKDYRITKLLVEGYVLFAGKNEGNPPPSEVNTFEIYVDGQRLVGPEENNQAVNWYYGPGAGVGEYEIADALPLKDDQASLFFGFWDVSRFDLSLHAEVKLSPAALEDWQFRVYRKVRAAEQKRIDAENNDLRQSYQSQLATYQNRLAELRATAVNELLQGQSEAFNGQVIMRELKRQCLAMLAKEFDADPSDDTLTNLDDTGARVVQSEYRRFAVKELPDAKRPTKVSASFELAQRAANFTVPDLPAARRKGRYIQFLEQAFEWQQLAYVCYPYFWATPPRWVELMNRSDDADPFLTAFLQAGSAKVLLAVSPGYDDAVLHYLATGEPWEGGPAPVIGDPLYIPLYEELRKQQDDLANATPDGESWPFSLPTSLVYLENSSTPLPALTAED